MTMGLIFAVAADREISLPGKRREEFKGVSVLGSGHFGTILFDESVPLSRSFGAEGEFHDRKAWRESREPDIVPVLRGEFRLGHATWWTADGADTQAFVFGSRAAESYNADGHVCLLPGLTLKSIYAWSTTPTNMLQAKYLVRTMCPLSVAASRFLESRSNSIHLSLDGRTSPL